MATNKDEEFKIPDDKDNPLLASFVTDVKLQKKVFLMFKKIIGDQTKERRRQTGILIGVAFVCLSVVVVAIWTATAPIREAKKIRTDVSNERKKLQNEREADRQRKDALWKYEKYLDGRRKADSIQRLRIDSIRAYVDSVLEVINSRKSRRRR